MKRNSADAKCAHRRIKVFDRLSQSNRLKAFFICMTVDLLLSFSASANGVATIPDCVRHSMVYCAVIVFPILFLPLKHNLMFRSLYLGIFVEFFVSCSSLMAEDACLNRIVRSFAMGNDYKETESKLRYFGDSATRKYTEFLVGEFELLDQSKKEMDIVMSQHGSPRCDALCDTMEKIGKRRSAVRSRFVEHCKNRELRKSDYNVIISSYDEIMELANRQLPQPDGNGRIKAQEN